MFDMEAMKQLVQEIESCEPVPLVDIPDIDLYMDQVITFMERKLAHLKKSERDKLLTKTMINNYTKAGLLMPPDKKKYSRQHIALLFMVYEAKQTLSINDMAMLFRPLVNAPGGAAGRAGLIDSAYTMATEMQDAGGCSLEEICSRQMETIGKRLQTQNFGDDQRLEFFLLVNFLLARAAQYKRLAEIIIERYLNGRPGATEPE